MDNLFFAFNVVFPLFALILIGMVLKKLEIVDDHYVVVANRVVFQLALPMLVFHNIYSSHSDPSTALPVIAYMVVGLLLLFVLNAFLVRRFIPAERQGVMMQNAVHSNSVLFGLPLVTNMFGDVGAATLSTIMPVTVPLFNTLSVLSHALASSKVKPSAASILRSLFKNMIIQAAVWALIIGQLGISLPQPLEQVIGDLAKLATPMALLALGASFQWDSMIANLKPLLFAASLRLIVYPLIMVSVAIAIGFRGMELAMMMVLFAGPIAVSSFVQTQQAGGDVQFTAQLIVVTTLLSAITLFAAIYALRSVGLI